MVTFLLYAALRFDGSLISAIENVIGISMSSVISISYSLGLSVNFN